MQDRHAVLEHSFELAGAKYDLVGITFYGEGHYHAILEDPEKGWWHCNGTGIMWPHTSFRKAHLAACPPGHIVYPRMYAYALS